MGLFGGSKSSTSSTLQTTNNTDSSNIQALAAARGDGNNVQVLDGDAIREAFSFASEKDKTSSKSLGEFLGVFDSLANKMFESAALQNAKALDTVAKSSSNVTSAVESAFSKSNNALDPQIIIFAIIGLSAFIIFKK